MFTTKLIIMKAAQLYWEENIGTSGYDFPGTAWIRLSTGKLCWDIGERVMQCTDIFDHLAWNMPVDLPSLKLTENELHTKLLHALELDEFHAMLGCSARWHPHNLPSSTASITLPSIWIHSDCVDSNSHQILTIPFTKPLAPNVISMRSWDGHPFRNEVMPTGWTRLEYLDNPTPNQCSFNVHVELDDEHAAIKWWISQQNYFRKHVHCIIGPKEEDYLPLHLITEIFINCALDTRLDGFTFRGTFMTDAPSNQVYLFLFPAQVEILGSCFTVAAPPDAERYYWAFDLDGVDRLTSVAATSDLSQPSRLGVADLSRVKSSRDGRLEVTRVDLSRFQGVTITCA
ncbi:hypothetical protein K438DRAFT_719824 [Mycena galopus ATCC 62051]|nr:hypothetical protein K438DRAFT_719824 [Mycena galopus ATCC 62051]